MQFYRSTSILAATLGVGSLADGFALLVSSGVARLIYAEEQMNRVMSYSLGAPASPGCGFISAAGLSAPVSAGGLAPGGSMAFHVSGSQIRTYLFDGVMGTLTSAVLDSAGLPGNSVAVSTSIGTLKAVQTFTVLGGPAGSHAALSTYGQEGLRLFLINANGSLSLTDLIPDSDKAHLGNISATATVSLDGQTYLLALSSLENGITSFAVDGAGKAELVDSLGNRDLLAISGPEAMQVVSLAGQSYAVIASVNSSSLSVVRVNAMGCLFETDHVVDDASTRFYKTGAMDTFTLNGRAFVVSAGTDAGITMMELLPGGRLAHVSTGVFETGEALFSVKGMEVVVTGSTAWIYVVDARMDRMHRFELSLADLGGVSTATGGVATGGSKDDLIMGGAGDDLLSGSAGDDRIVSGGGADTLFGGAGEDVFIFASGSDNLLIADFELHTDRMDLSDWGRVYSASALTYTATASGCIISLNGHEVTLVAGQSLTSASFTDADFYFGPG